MKKMLKITLPLFGVAIIATGCSVKPKAIPKSDVQADVSLIYSRLDELSAPVTKPITLKEAMDRAIQHNLMRKVDRLTVAMEKKKIDIAAYESLPSLTAQAGYSERNSYAATQSTTFAEGMPGDPTNSFSVSQDKISKTDGVSFSWNILDFGLSYVRAGQQANRYLIAKEKERKSIYNIKEEVRNAYYKAVSADELLRRVQPLLRDTRAALKDSKNIEKLKLDTPLKSLTYQRELLEVIRSLHALEENLNNSKIELSKLMGLKPGTQFRLAERIHSTYRLPRVRMSMKTLERHALEQRSEIQQSRYQEKISKEEVKAAMLKMLPGINLSTGYNYDSNQYLLNNEWAHYGANISWNLLNVFNANQNRQLAKTQLELAKQQKLALSMAIISQVHMAMIDYTQAQKEYALSKEYYGVAKDIYGIIQNENKLDVNGKLTLIKEKLNFLIATLRLSSSYAKVQNAYGRVISSVGEDAVFDSKERSQIDLSRAQEAKKSIETPVVVPVKPTKPAETTKAVQPKVTEKESLKAAMPKAPTPPQQSKRDAFASLLKHKSSQNAKSEKVVSKSQAEQEKSYGVLKNSANVREKANHRSKVVKQFAKGQKIEILKKYKNWYQTPDGYIWDKSVILN
jgi:outer membrane protein TolC